MFTEIVKENAKTNETMRRYWDKEDYAEITEWLADSISAESSAMGIDLTDDEIDAQAEDLTDWYDNWMCDHCND